MTCNNNCKYFSFVTNATTSGTNIVLTLSNTPAVVNENRICFRFSRNIVIPANSATYPVLITIGSTNYALWDKYGQVMTGADLIKANNDITYCSRFVYHAYFGSITSGETTTTHIIVHNIPRASYTIYCE